MKCVENTLPSFNLTLFSNNFLGYLAVSKNAHVVRLKTFGNNSLTIDTYKCGGLRVMARLIQCVCSKIQNHTELNVHFIVTLPT